MKMKSLLTLALALVVSACGNSVGSKEDAAKAAQATQAAGGAATASSAMASPLLAGATVGTSVSVTGKSGTADVKMLVDANDNGGNVKYEITFNGFSSDGKNTFDGTMTYESNVSGNGGGFGSVSTSQKGKVSMSGDFDSELDMDVKTAIEFSGTSISMVIEGYVNADGTRYDYAKESFSFTASTK